MTKIAKTSLVVILLILANISQTKSQEIICSGGDYFKNNEGSVSFTIGEPVRDYFAVDKYWLTQGFQQSTIAIITNTKEEDKEISLSVFPNPTYDFIIISADYCDGLKYQLYSFNGNLLQQGDMVLTETKLTLSKFPPAIYVLRIIDNLDILSTYKIIKQ